MNYYIRFTSDIYADIDRGGSVDFRTKRKFKGLCAWAIHGDYNPYDRDSILEAAEKTAKSIAANSYGGYGSATEYAVIEGQLTGESSNDGSVIEVLDVLATRSL